MAKRPKEKMTEQEIAEWDELYQYVRKNILGYDENQKVPQYMVIRLKGLREGNYMANRRLPKNANYPYPTILNTFKLCYRDIKYAMSHKSFKNENHKVNYIMAVIESNLNDVYLKMKKKKEEDRAAEKASINMIPDASAMYKKKSKKESKNLSDLW